MPSTEASKNSSSDEKIRLLKEISQLHQKIKTLERERNNTVFNKKSELRPFYSDLEDTAIKIDDDRKNESLKLRRDLDRLKSNVRSFRNTVLDLKTGTGRGETSGQTVATPSLSSVEKLKEKVEEIDGNINSFKSSHRENYENFVFNEKSLSQELAALDRRIDAWDLQSTSHNSAPNGGQSVASSSKVKIYNITNDFSSTKPQEVIEFEKFMEQHGGLKGGWEEYDHVTFVKYYQLLYRESSNNDDVSRRRLIERLAVELPHRGMEDLETHFGWYKKYLELAEKKKFAITQWRKQRDQEKTLKTKGSKEELSNGVEGEEKDGIEVDEEDLRRAEEKRELLKAWREHKEEEKRAALELEKQREEEQKERERAHLARQKEIKAQIDEMKRKKAHEDEIERMRQLADQLEVEHQRKSELREKRIQSTKKVLAQAEEKKEMKKLQELAQSERAKYVAMRKQMVDAKVPRDPNRLLQPTKGWVNRVREMEESEEDAGKSVPKWASGALAVNKIPHRAVPSWRSNVSF